MEKQYRSYFDSQLTIETREAEGKSGKTLRGYAAVFNSLSANLGWYRERLFPGGFAGPLNEKQDVRALQNHDKNLVLARTTNDTLRLRQDNKGLFSEIDLADTSFERDLAIKVERGDINQMSFAFSTRDYEWTVEDGEYIRNVRSVKRLFDVSPVTYPAYEATSVGLRHLGESVGLPFDFSQLVPALMRADEGLPASKEDVEVVRSAIASLSKLQDKLLLSGERAKDAANTVGVAAVGERLAALRGDSMSVDALKERLNVLRG